MSPTPDAAGPDPDPALDPRQIPRRYPRWALRAAYAVEGLCARALPGKRWYAGVLRRSLKVVRQEVWMATLPPEFDRYRVVHISDLHAGPFLDAASLGPVVDAANACEADLVALTGDYLTHRVEEGVELAPALHRLRARDGVFSVFGNHDYRARREGEMEAAFRAGGIETLRNRGVPIRRGPSSLWIAGIEDVEEGKVVDLAGALRDRGGTDARCSILLAHHPDSCAAAAGYGVSLVLSGHTHGGQVALFGRGLLPGMRSRFRYGLHQTGLNTQVFVTRGVGVLHVPVRIGAPPEVACLVLRRGLAPGCVS